VFEAKRDKEIRSINRLIRPPLRPKCRNYTKSHQSVKIHPDSKDPN